jgi:uncharacterized protein YutE (UPF0331/DUF86 family)
MPRADLVASRLADVADRIERVRAHCPVDVDTLARDRDALDLVSFNLMLAVQAAADIASHLIATEGWPAPGSLAASFARLRDHGVIRAETAAAMGRAAGLRNVVAHGYAGVDAGAVFVAATEGVRDLEAFCAEIAHWLAQPAR